MGTAADKSSLARVRIFQRLLLLAVLTAGAIVFAFPFVNMVCTSAKLDEEMGAESFSLLPRVPVAQYGSPFVSPQGDHDFVRPADMSRRTWNELLPRLRQTVAAAVERWWDKRSEERWVTSAFGEIDRRQLVETITPVVGSTVLNRIGDDARRAGVDAMAADAARLVTDDLIRDAFNEYVGRISLGNVRVRLSAEGNYAMCAAGSPRDWQSTSPSVTMVDLQPPLARVGQSTRIAKWNGSVGHPVSVAVVLPAVQSADAKLPLLHADQAALVDRVYVQVQTDQSWAKVGITVTANGRAYESDEPLWSAERKWLEVELRLPGRELMPLAGRQFLKLRDAGVAPAGSPAFSVQLTLIPSTAAGACWAKASRNYYTAFREIPIVRYVATSVSLAILSVLLTLLGSSLSAYAFARIEFPGRNVLFAMLLATMMIPGQVTMIPGFLIHKSLGWYNTLYPLWIPAAFGSAFFIFMMRQFFMSIPRELEESARIDGCGFLRIYWHIMLPLIRPTLLTVAIFSFMGSWNNFMGPLIYVNDERLYNLAFGLFRFQLASSSSTSLLMAGSFVMTLPIIAMFFLFQRYFVQGISLTGMGGR